MLHLEQHPQAFGRIAIVIDDQHALPVLGLRA